MCLADRPSPRLVCFHPGIRGWLRLPATFAYVALDLLLATGLSAIPLKADAANWNTTAGVSITETYSDNIASAGAGLARREFVTDFTPNVHLNTSGGRLSLNLDASFHGLRYAQGTSPASTQTALNSSGRLEVLDKWLYVDSTASISQQVISPFGNQNINLANINSNRTQVRNLTLAPNLAGVFASELYYNLRMDNAISRTDSDTVAGNRLRTWNGSLRWGSNSRLLNWGTSFSQSSTIVPNQMDSITRSARANIFINPDAQTVITLFSGKESNNYSISGQASRTSGINVNWNASERTQISAGLERHPFGTTNQFALSHRMQRSAWQLSYNRSISSTSSNGTVNAFSSDYENFYLLCTAGGYSATQCATATVQILQLLGRPVYKQLPFLSNTSFIQQTLQASVALSGVRNTVTLNFSRSDSRNESTNRVLTDVLTQNSGILQNSMSINWALKVSPFSSLTASMNRSRTTNLDPSLGDTTSITYYLMWTTQLTQKLMGSLNLRRMENKVSSGTGIPFRENSMVGTVGYTY